MNVSTMHDKGVYFCTDFQKSLGGDLPFARLSFFPPLSLSSVFRSSPSFPVPLPSFFCCPPVPFMYEYVLADGSREHSPNPCEKMGASPCRFFPWGDKARGVMGATSAPIKSVFMAQTFSKSSVARGRYE